MANNKITFFACDNGDASLIQAHGQTVMTDNNYRLKAADENDDTNDYAPIIRKSCDNDYLDVFILTHPDEDHLRGFSEIFHLGKPDSRDDDPDEGDVKIVVNEIWCSKYSENPNYVTDASKPLLSEIKRRKKLIGTADGEKNGNRLVVLTSTDRSLNKITDGLEWRLLAPNDDEGDIPKAKEGEPKNSSNPASLVIQWNITVGSKTSKILLGGDSTVEIWERLSEEATDDELEWNVLLAPHHCSRHSLGRDVVKDGDNEFEWSEDAYDSLNHPINDKSHVVCSSRKFGDKTPPNPYARSKYHKMLAFGKDVNATVKNRFLCTADNSAKKVKNIVFKFTSSGPTKATFIASAGISSSTSSQGGGYGNNE